jgi:hypothetical protein
MGDQNKTGAIDFSDLGGQAVTPSSGTTTAAPIDFSDLGGQRVSPGTTSPYWDDLKDKYGLPHNVDLSKTFAENVASGRLTDQEIQGIDLNKYSQAWQEANPDLKPTSFFGRAWDEGKRILEGATGEAPLFGSLPNPIGDVQGLRQGAAERMQEFRQNPAAASAATAVDAAALFGPFLLSEGAERLNPINPTAAVERALGRQLDLVEANTPRPGGSLFPALNNTPREVLQEASRLGIKLTPGQVTEDPFALQLQEHGKVAVSGGSKLNRAILDNKAAFEGAVADMQDQLDPKRMGLSAESAGENIQHSASVAKDVAHTNASQGYKQIQDLMGQQVDPTKINAAWRDIRGNLPMAAEDQILGQTPRNMRAVVEDLLSGNPEGFKPTFENAIRLRTMFRELGETEGLPNSQQAIYRRMENAVDSSMQDTSDQLGRTRDWRAANQGWADYTQKYGDKSSVFNKILKQGDPTRIVTMLQHAPATDIAAIKAEGMDAGLEPLRRQVLSDIASRGFSVRGGELGGYSDAYLRELFGPDTTKNLYLKADLAGRLRINANPSGTGGNIASVSQLGLNAQAKATAAARYAMPRDPLSFLPEAARQTPPIRTTPFSPALPTTLPASRAPAQTGSQNQNP